MNETIERNGTFKSGDLDIFYRAFGKPGSTPVLIVHGLSYFSYDWIDVAAALADSREVVAMDMRGFGNSSPSATGAYKVQDFTQDILALLDTFGWRKAALMGHSMGGRNATYAASAHPARVDRLILVDWSPQVAKAGSQRVTDTVVDMPDIFPDLDAAMRYFKIDPSTATPKQRARYEAYFARRAGGYAVKRDPYFREQFRRVRDEGFKPDHGADLWQCLSQVTCPILVLRGTSSDLFESQIAAKMSSVNPRLELLELKGGHNLADDNPGSVVGAVRRFLH